MKTGKLLYNARNALGLTMVEVAKRLGFKSHHMVYQIEHGKKKLPESKIEAISSILKISTDEIKTAMVFDYDKKLRSKNESIKTGNK